MKKFASLLLAVVLVLSMMSFASAETINIDFWTMFTGADGTTMSELVDMFNASQNEVHVNHVIMENNDVVSKVTMSAGDNESLPHIFMNHSWRTPTFISNNAILPISTLADVYKDFDFSMTNWKDSAKLYNMVGDVRYCITTDFPTNTMYANVDLVNQYAPGVLDDGVVTWDEIGEIADKLEAEGSDIKIVGATAVDTLVQNYFEQGYFYCSNDDLNTFAVNRDALIASITPWKTYFDRGVLWEEGDDINSLFATQEMMFFFDGSWAMNNIKQYGFDFVLLPTPMLKAENAFLSGGQHAMFLPNRTYTDAELQAMGKFIQFFFENEIKWAEAGSVLAYIPATEAKEYAAFPQNMLARYEYWDGGPAFVHTDVVEQTWSELGFEVLYGNMSVEEYVDVFIRTCEERIAAKN